MNINLSLKELRLALGLNQDRMAELLQWERASLSMAELGQRPTHASKLDRLERINQILNESFGPEITSASTGLNARRQELLEKLKVEEENLKKKIKAAENALKQVQALARLLAGMNRLESPDFKTPLDQAWKAMMEVALPDMEELAWNLEKLKLDLEGVLAKRRLLEKI
jgi:transcriptional regulator with XRE-family HTH domain